MISAIVTKHRYPALAAQADCGSKAYHGWMIPSAFNASWRAAQAVEAQDAERADRENITRAALIPYPWTGIYKAYTH
jgi:hypothetical protein